MIINFIFLPVLFFIGIVTSYQDFKIGKIKNKWIALGVIYGVLAVLCMVLWNFFGQYITDFYYIKLRGFLPDEDFRAFTFQWIYLCKIGLNSVIAFLVGYLFWRFDFWSAGDAKLFFVFALLLPLKFYWQSYLPIFPSAILLINIFVTALLFLFIHNLYYIIKKIINFNEFKHTVRRKYAKMIADIKKNKKKYMKEAMGYLLIFSFFAILKNELGTRFSGEAQALVFLVVVYSRKILRVYFKNVFYLYILLSIVLGYLCFGRLLGLEIDFVQFLSSMKTSLIFVLFFPIVSMILSFSARRENIAFAFWMFVGLILTIIFEGSFLSFFLMRGR